MSAPEWFEDEGFWLTYAPLMFDESCWAEVPEAVDNILRLSAVRKGAKILDTCCGVGRHAVDLARRGFAVTGVDITQAYLDAAQETADATGVVLELVKADVRLFSRPGWFDLCTNLFTSFGYFATREEDISMLRHCAENLAPGGCFILETLGKEVIGRDFVEREEFERAGWRVTTEYEVVGPWEGLKNRWILQNETTRVDRSFVLRLYSGCEMRWSLEKAGFRTVSILGGLDGRPYDNRAVSLVAVARV